MIYDVIGYVIKDNCYHNKFHFKGTAYNITRFIMQFGHEESVRIILTNSSDEFILSTYGEFIDQIVEQVYDNIIGELLQLQQGKAFEQMTFEETEPGVMVLIKGN